MQVQECCSITLYLQSDILLEDNYMRIIYFIVGLITLAIGAIGAVLPMLPSFPFLLLSAICFAKSSKRMHDWLVETNMYKKVVVPLRDEKKMTLKNKIKIMALVTVLMSIGFVMMNEVVIGQIVLACVWLFHMYYFIFRIKTKKAENL